MKFPWEIESTEVVPVTPASLATVEDKVQALMDDFVYAVRLTAIKVHSNKPELAMIVNTERGQIVPRGECRFSDGTTKIEFTDMGMPQPGVLTMSVPDLVATVFEKALALGLSVKL